MSKTMAIDNYWEAFLSGSAAAKVIDIGWHYVKQKRAQKTAASDSIQTTVKIYNSLQNISSHQCTRRVIFKAHNGGKVLDARTHKYASVLYEDPKPPFSSIVDDVQGWRIDDSYARMLDKIVKYREFHIHISEMEDGRLKDLYESDGVKMSCLYYLGEDGFNLYYASFATHLDIPHFDTKTRKDILISIDQITKYMKL